MKSYIGQDGKYYEGTPDNSYDLNSLDKSRRHEIERKKFAREIIQPHRDGKANPEFVRAYPVEATEYFTQDEIMRAEREL